MNRRKQTLGQAFLVFAAYGIGAWLGFQLRFPPATTSVLWPPNAILTATLLLAPPRRWWIYLLAALPAHLLVERREGLPMPLVLGLFLTNSSEALVAGALMHRFSDAPARLDSLRRVATFIACVVLAAPFLTSFPDATAVWWIRGETFWRVVRTRFYSNSLAAVTLAPAFLVLARASAAALREMPRRRRIEAGVLAIGLLGLGTLVFSTPGGWKPPGSLFPLLLWAAIRFGPAGASLSLLVTTLLATGAATQRTGPWASLPPSEGVMALQIFLSSLGISLLCLAALTQEHHSAVLALQARLRFEGLLARISGAFVQLPSDQMDTAFEVWLGRVGDFFGLERALLLRAHADRRQLEVSHAWAAPGVEVPTPDARQGIAATLDEIRHQPLSSFDRRWSFTVPLVVADQVVGGLAFVGTGPAEGRPSEPDQRLIADVFASALARKETEDALRAGELMKSAILTSLTSLIAVLDCDGRIIAVNESWKRFATSSANPDSAPAPGLNYLEACRRACRPPMPDAEEAIQGIEGVLAGWLSSYGFEYACRTPAGDRWFALSAVPLQTADGGAVVSHTDVTERRRAGIEAQQSRQELAHFLRVSTMGELTSSLAHELNQPLTAVLANAQAAHRLLERPHPDPAELREILADIIEEDKRAGEVIRRLRALLRKGEPERARLDLNDVIQDVVKLLGGDAVNRNISIRVELDSQPPTVTGDRIQLQQVVLNLVLNAMDATADRHVGDRTIVVRTERIAHGAARVSVADTGLGLPPETLERAFEPFYTTKPAGMGMGLSIARSIIEAHSGTISATNRPTGGAVFTFSLPPTAGSHAKI